MLVVWKHPASGPGGVTCVSEGIFERVAEDFSNRFVKNDRGEMVPYRSFLQLKMKQRLNESDR